MEASSLYYFFFVHVPEKNAKEPPLAVLKDLHNKLDLLGFAIFAAASIMLLLAVQYGGNVYSWNSSVVIGLFCGSGASFLTWLGWNYYKKDIALIPVSMIRIRHVWSSCLVYGTLSASMFTTSYYLPIYFQGVKAASPTMSGVYLLPSILSQLISAVLSGKIVGRFGYYIPASLFCAVLMAVGYGLLSTFNAQTSTAEWIGYQILFGFGRGAGLQMPIIAVQNTLPPKQISVAIALVVFSSSMGGALFLSFADTIFTNSLGALVQKYAPKVNAEVLVNAGAYGFRRVVPKGQLISVLKAYSESIDRVFYMCAALAVACFAFSWGMGWKDIRKEKTPVNTD